MTIFANFFTLVSHLKQKLQLYLNNCLLDTHEIARKRGRTTESTFISADPVPRFFFFRFSGTWKYFLSQLRRPFNWHESEERLSNKDIAGKKQELENLNTMLAEVLFRLLFLYMNFCD